MKIIYDINSGRAKQFIYFRFFIIYWSAIIPILLYMFLNNQIAIGGTDGVTQHYVAMVYVRRVWRKIIHTLIYEQRLIYPFYDLNLGMGGNTLSTLNWYGLTDPFYLFTAFIPENWLVYFYSILFYFRIFLGGIVFIAFCKEYDGDDNRKAVSYIVAALVYCFSGFTVQGNIHIIFTHAIIYTPLMFLGVERNLKHKKTGILAASVFLYALSGFYYLYISSLGIAVYTIYHLVLERAKVKTNIKKIFYLLKEYLVGLGLSAFVFIPTIYGFFLSTRTDGSNVEKVFLSIGEIKELFANVFMAQFSTSRYVTNTQVMSLCTVGVICVIFTFANRKDKKNRNCILALLICAMIPAISWIMSGFGKVYDRWEILIVFYFAYLVLISWEKLFDAERTQKNVLGICFFPVLYCGFQNIREGNIKYAVIIIMYSIYLLMLLFCSWTKNKENRLLCVKIFSVLAVVSALVEWLCVFRTFSISEIRKYKTEDELIWEVESDAYRIEYEEAFEGIGVRLGMNRSLLLGYNGIQQYFSIENYHYAKAFDEWDAWELCYGNGGLDQRTVLEALASVKYFIIRNGDDVVVPFGYEWIKNAQDEIWGLYENEYALPLAYAYDYVYDCESYSRTSGLEKQNIILKTAVAESYAGDLPRQDSIDSNIETVDVSIDEVKNGEYNGDCIYAVEGTELTIEFQMLPEKEYYLETKQILPIKVEIGGELLKSRTPMNLGNSSENKLRKIKIIFEAPAELARDSIQVLSYDLEDFTKDIDNRRRGVEESSIYFENNTFGVNVEFENEKMLCVAIPYEKGWSATVDGISAKIYKINSMYMGIEIPQGRHQVILHYETPGLRIGLIISCVTLGLIIIKLGRDKIISEEKKHV